MPASAAAQDAVRAIPAATVVASSAFPALTLPDVPVASPDMSPELALQSYENNAQRQLSDLAYSSDNTVIEAALPGTGQKGRFELKRSYQAPKSLAYGAVKFVGDNFVKNNIILKLLTSEVDHVEKGEGANTAITEENYKFSYKGRQTIAGKTAYEYRVKPRHKRVGLFKGRVFIDAASGHILRAEGTLVRSPSVLVKKIDFVQDYEQVAGFSLPVRTHSVAKTRLFGEAVVDISHSDVNAAPLHTGSGDNSAASGALQ
ncbi:MAG: hypothetical protein ACRD3E_03675 [Terriglobales bacterium]